MSWEAVKQVIELGPSSGLTDRQFRVLLHLADRLNTKTGQLNPSARRVALDIGLPPEPGNISNIRRTMRELEALGVLPPAGPGTGGREAGGRYPSRPRRLDLDALSALARGVTERSRGVTRTPLSLSPPFSNGNGAGLIMRKAL